MKLTSSTVLFALLAASSLLAGCASEPQRPPSPQQRAAQAAAAPQPSAGAPESIAEVGEPAATPAPHRERVRATSISPGLHAVRTTHPLRQRPQALAEVITIVNAGTPVKVVQILNSALGHWAYVEAGSESGWMAIDAFASSR